MSLVGLLIVAVAAFVYFAMIRRQASHEMAMGQAATGGAAKVEPTVGARRATPTPSPASQDNAIFVPPEKQQLIGMRSVPAEMGTLTKEIRITGKVTYDETHQTHIHSKVSGYIDLRGLLSPAERAVAESKGGVLNGIAYDASGDRLFVTGKLWPKLFEIRLAPR